MDRNNDIQVNKVDKWCEGVADVSLLQAKKSVDMFLSCYSPMLSIEALDAVRTIYVALDEALDHFNELEAKYQEACGMISQYEKENRTLRELRKLVNANNKKVAEDNHNLRQERDRHIDLLDKLRWALEDRGIRVEWSERALKWNLHDNANICESCKKHFEDELRIRCEEIDGKNKLIEELRQKDDALQKMIREVTELEKEKVDLEDRLALVKHGYLQESKEIEHTISDLKADVRDLEAQARVNASTASTYKSELKQVIELAKSYGVIIYDDRKDAKSDDAINIGMCGHYYVLDEQIKNENARLKDKINRLEEKNEELRDALAYCEMTGFTMKSLSDSIKNKAKRARNIDSNGDDI